MKILKTIAGLLCVSLLTGCSYMFDQNDWDLPSDPVSYQVQTSEEYGMDSITVEGREYLPFGQYSQKEKGIMVSSCMSATIPTTGYTHLRMMLSAIIF